MSRGEVGTGSLRATLIAWDNTFVTLITTATDKPKVLALEVTPYALIGNYSPEFAATWRNTWTQRLARFNRDVDLSSTTSMLERIFDPSAFQSVLELALHRPPEFLEAPVQGPFPAELLQSAFDAWTYVQATDRSESPRQAVADHRGVTSRTAEGRIRRARERELLTHPKNNRASSMLTEKAAEVLEGYLGHRPYPYVAEDGEVVLGPTQ